MNIACNISGTCKVYNCPNTNYVKATSCNISCDKKINLLLSELLQSIKPLCLSKIPMQLSSIQACQSKYNFQAMCRLLSPTENNCFGCKSSRT
eukprot:Gb_16545 [translate_table: standard]